MRIIDYVLVILILGAVAFNYYTMDQVGLTKKYIKAEVAQIIQVQDSIQFAAVTQEITRIEARRSLKLEIALEQATQILKAHVEENARLTQVLEETSTTSAELIKDNAELQTKLDTLSVRYEERVREVEELRKLINTL